jgi:hypothetical protein
MLGLQCRLNFIMAAVAKEFDLDGYLKRTGALDLTGVAWSDVPRHPITPEAVRTLRYMQDVEHHTIVFSRTIFTKRAINDPIVGPFFVSWLYEETFHGRALDRFLDAAGHSVVPRGRRECFDDKLESLVTDLLSWIWKDFLALHMTWGAIHELTTLTSYQRFSKLAGHSVLSDLLSRIIRDEARHFHFYFRQAQSRLERSSAARVTRFFIDRLWTPVGSGVQPLEEMRFVAGYLYSGEDGRAAARKIDKTICQLPGLRGAPLFEAWLEKEVYNGSN